MHFGIDYGSKLAGTTVITYDIGNTLFQISSKKKEDADATIVQVVKRLKPSAIYVDAPLSLPGAYFGKGENYFYRNADIELKAMSPMFLGGLTARAMKLNATLSSLNVDIYETYPGALIRSIPTLEKAYSKKDLSSIPSIMSQIALLIDGFQIIKNPVNIHQLDSILAWYSGLRHQKGISIEVGDKEEGVIIY